MRLRTRLPLFLLRLAITGLPLCGVASGAAQAQLPTTPNLQSCAALPTEAQRLQCTDSLLGRGGTPPQVQPVLNGGWQLSRAIDPRSGTTSIAVMHTADISNSDVNFAGLMFRCGRPATEALLVMLDPISPSAKPSVALHSNNATSQFTAQVLQPGTLLLLPDAATTGFKTLWSAAPTITIDITVDQATIHGVVATTGLQGALQTLESSCRAQ